jgi:beta-fructofuranosidase
LCLCITLYEQRITEPRNTSTTKVVFTMPLHFNNKWVWDFWYVQDGQNTHIFYLQKARDPQFILYRYLETSIGHAVSQDLRHWTPLRDAVQPGIVVNGFEQFDSITTAAGSIIRHNSEWYLLYTGCMNKERGRVQRIGLATSSDLTTWRKHPRNPVLVADPAWYEVPDFNIQHDLIWGDPFVFRDESTGLFHAFISARAKDGDWEGRGVIGHAQSDNLVDWEVLPPVTEPGDFFQMAMPQVVQIGARYYLLFSAQEVDYSRKRKERLRDREYVTGTHYLVADNILGPYHRLSDDVLYGDHVATYYGGRLIQDSTGEWKFIAYFNNDGTEFVGDISDPMSVEILPDGRLKAML